MKVGASYIYHSAINHVNNASIQANNDFVCKTIDHRFTVTVTTCRPDTTPTTTHILHDNTFNLNCCHHSLNTQCGTTSDTTLWRRGI